MAQDCVVAVFDQLPPALNGVAQLEQAGLGAEHISLVTHDVKRQLRPEQRESLSIPEEATEASATGAAAGGLVGLLLGAPLLAVPIIGPLLIAGPLATGLTGAVVGGFLGSMSHWGVKEDHIAHYQSLVSQGHPLLVVIGRPDEVANARRILEAASPSELHSHVASDDEAIDHQRQSNQPTL